MPKVLPLFVFFLCVGHLTAQNPINVPVIAIGRYYPMSVHEPYENDSIYYFYDSVGRRTSEIHKDREDGRLKYSYSWEYLPDNDHLKETRLERRGSTLTTVVIENIVLRDEHQRVMSEERKYSYQSVYYSNSNSYFQEYSYYADSVLIRKYYRFDPDTSYKFSGLEVYSNPDSSGHGFHDYRSYYYTGDSLKLSKSMSNVKYAVFDMLNPDANIILSGTEYLPNEVLRDRYYEVSYSDTQYHLRVMSNYDTIPIVCSYNLIRWDEKHRIIYSEHKQYEDFYPEEMAWDAVTGGSQLYEYDGDNLVHQLNKFKHELYADMIVYSELYYTSFSSVGIKETIQEQLVLSPNPAKDYIVLRTIPDESLYVIHDATGKKVVFGEIESQKMISVSNLPHGMYILQINTPGGVLFGRFLKE